MKYTELAGKHFESVVIDMWNEYLTGTMPFEDIVEFEERLNTGQFKRILGF